MNGPVEDDAGFLNMTGMYGLDIERQQIQEMFRDYMRLSSSGPIPPRSRSLYVKGPSGSGKTLLVLKSLRDAVEQYDPERPGFLVTGKFDQYLSGRPFAALVDAMNQLCDSIEASPQCDEIISRIEETLSARWLDILRDLIPNLASLVPAGDETSTATPASSQADQSFDSGDLKYAVRDLCRAVTHGGRPLVLFLDDLQWGDTTTLKIVEFLAVSSTAVNGARWFVVGAYRGLGNEELEEELEDVEEFEGTHPFLRFFEALQERSDQHRFEEITLSGKLSPEGVLSMVAGLLEMDSTSAEVIWLANVVKSITMNPHFVKLSMRELMSRGYLQFRQGRWHWDLDDIERDKTDIFGQDLNIANIRLRGLPELAIRVLAVAACLSSQINLTVLTIVLQDVFPDDNFDEQAVEEYVEEAVRQGVVSAPEEIGEGTNARFDYRFTHDQFHASAYERFNPRRAETRFLVMVGDSLKRRQEAVAASFGDGDVVFLIAQLYNRASSCIQEDDRLLEVARLNLEAAEIASRQGAFNPAAIFLRYAEKALQRRTLDMWRYECDLTRRIICLLAKMEYCYGDFKGCITAIESIIMHAPNSDEREDLYVLEVEARGAISDITTAFDLGCETMKQLGFTFPKAKWSAKTNAYFAYFWIRYFRVKSMSDQDLLSLPPAKDTRHLIAMDIMSRLVVFSYYQSDNEHMLLIALRMMSATLEHGRTKYTAFAFTMYGYIMCILGDIESAFRFEKLALRMLDEDSEPFVRLRCAPPLYLILHPMRHHVWECLDPILESYRLGMQSGHILDAGMCLISYIMLYLFSGRSLLDLHDSIRGWSSMKKSRGSQLLTLAMNQEYDSVIMFLMGVSREKVGDLRKKGLNTSVGEEVAEDRMILAQTNIFVRLLVAIFMNDMDQARQMDEDWENLKEKMNAGASIHVGPLATYRALVAVDRWRNSGSNKKEQKKWRLRFKSYKEELQTWMNHKWKYVEHLLLLLKAEELRVLESDVGKVRVAYNKAIKACYIEEKEHYRHDRALFNEQAARFFEEKELSKEAKEYWREAHKFYREWGARRKVKQLEQNHGFLVTSVTLTLARSMTWSLLQSSWYDADCQTS